MRARRLRLCLVALVAVFAGRAAYAADAPAAPIITPPRVLVEPHAAYPEGGIGAAEVLLELVVGEDGRASEIRVVRGDEPFASAAAESARGYFFDPATRGGRPLAARIRVAVSFVPPEPEAPATEEARTAAAPPPAPRIEEVRVLGQREPKTPTEHRLGRGEMRLVPGAFGDPFRAIDMLPGVVPVISGLPYFYLRGAPPSAIGYYVDEVRVPYLFHFALGPGVIQPAIVDEVALHPAAYPARYGRFAGGIVAGTTRPPAKELYGEAQIRPFDAGAYVEAPFAEGRGTAGVGGRYSYSAALLSLVAKDITVDYRDYNARVAYDLSDRWRATLFTFGSYDLASQKKDGVDQVQFASEFYRADVRLDRKDADGSTTRIATTLGLDRTRLTEARFAEDLLLGVRGYHRRPISREVDVELGADFTNDHYMGGLPNRYAVSRDTYDNALLLFRPRNDAATGVWLSATYRPAEGWDLTGTLRADMFTSVGNVAVGPSPRASMRVPITHSIAFLGALGIATQPPAFSIPVPAVGYAGLPGGLAYAWQKSAGAEVKLPLRFTLTAVGYHHTYFGLRDFSQNRGDVDLEKLTSPRSSPTQAYGAELFLSRKLTERFGAFSSVTLSRAQIGSDIGAPAGPSAFDRAYVVQVGGSADLGRSWRASARFLTYGGWPTDPNDGGPRTDERLPPYYRLDVRLEKRWVWSEHRWIALVIEGLNVTGSKEILSRSCDLGICENQEFGPLVIPSIGVEGAL